jgi:hypothetical protein
VEATLKSTNRWEIIRTFKNHWYYCRKIGTMNKIKPKEQYSIMKKTTEPMVTCTNNRKSSSVIVDARDDIRCVIFSEEF